MDRGEATEAISLFQEALGYNSGDVDAYVGLGRAFLMNGDWGKAKETVVQAMRLNPRAPELIELLQQVLTAPR